MKRSTSPIVDSRRAADLVDALLRRRPGYLEAWEPSSQGPGAALLRVGSRYLEAVLERLNQAPEKNKLAFLQLLGIELIPARPARAPVVFQLAADAPAVRLPAGSRVGAPPPPESSSQIVFETERDLGLSPAKLQQVVSLWPGRDQYVDHSAAQATGESFRLFERPLKDTRHALYIAHDTLLALSGDVRLEVEFELAQGGSEPLDIVWEYWDGEVWRGFKDQHRQCAETDAEKLDGTLGLTTSGRFRLLTECAESATTTVNGVEANWIRGRLDEPLPLDPEQILPEVTELRLSAIFHRGATLKRVSRIRSEIPALVKSSDGQSLDSGAYFEIFEVAPMSRLVAAWSGNGFLGADLVVGREYKLVTSYGGSVFNHRFIHRGPFESEELILDLGIPADAAFANAETLDLTKPFFPLGQQPQPGAAFYFTSEEAFSKPGAQLLVHVEMTETPQDLFNISAADGRAALNQQVAWEYWNGREWARLDSSNFGSTASTKALTATGQVELIVPNDITPLAVNDEEALWMRARLLKGGYGFTQRVEVNDSTLTYVVHRPPALAGLRLSYTWEYGPFHAEQVFADNDFHFQDRTEAAKWPDIPFTPYHQVADLTPALYMGFDQQLPVDRLNLYFDPVEDPAEASGPALVWEYWQGFNWRLLSVEDETRGLAHPGMVSFLGPADAKPVARFGQELYFLRARLKEDSPPPEREMRGIHANAVWAAQRQTIPQETVGTSNGEPRQVFTLRNVPVLEGERIEVRESSGPRAAVEWRLLAAEVLTGGEEVIRRIEDRLGDENLDQDIVEGDLRLRRDRFKKVNEVWVRWHPSRHLLAAGAGDRRYVLARARGLLSFGDGLGGKIPPLGAEVRALQYVAGGGRAGNVAAHAVTQALNGVAGVEKVFNPSPAEGGADSETLEALTRRGPRTLRHRGRALLPGDLETMAFEASAAVAVARALPLRDNAGRARPGWAGLVIVPHSAEPRPQPSFGLRETVRRYLEVHAEACLAAGRQIHVRGPEYRAIDVDADLAPQDPAKAGAVEAAVRAALEDFLHPLRGGGVGAGWEPGRDVYLSDMAAVLERVKGVDYVSRLTLSIDGLAQGESARVPDGETVVAGEIRLQLILPEEGL